MLVFTRGKKVNYLRTGALHIVVVIVIIAVVREAPLLTTVHRHPFFRGRGGGVEVDRVLGFTWCRGD